MEPTLQACAVLSLPAILAHDDQDQQAAYSPKPKYVGQTNSSLHQHEKARKPSDTYSTTPPASCALKWPSLYGGLIDRVKEQHCLQRALQRCCSSSSSSGHQPEITIVTGKSGSGKTALMQAFRRNVEDEHGYFLSAKFDQFHQCLPYQVFVHAFTDFVKQVTERAAKGDESDPAMIDLRERIVKAVESDSKLLTDMVPALLQWIPHVESCGNVRTDLQTRFKSVFSKFISAMCCREHPVVLFLDDLQWSDAASLELLREVAFLSGDGLLIVGACRGNEVSTQDALSIVLRDLEQNNVTVNEILISHLNAAAVNTFVAQTLSLPEAACQDLSNLAFQSTEGNTFFLKQYLRSLHENGILYMDELESWQWENATVCHEDDVVQLVLQNVQQRFDEEVKEVLKVASCLGTEFDEYLLLDVFDDNSVNLPSVFDLLQQFELLTVDARTGAIRFCHDKIQQACYSMIPQSERAAFHLQLGRTLWTNLSTHDLSLNVFLVVNQITIGLHLVDDQDERSRLAILCLRAGERAFQSSAFRPAEEYLELGISLLSRRNWRDEYTTSLAIYSAKCEVEYVLGEFDKVDVIAEELFHHARCFHDKLRAYNVKVYALGSRNQPEEAITLGLEVLKKLGQPFPRKARIFQIVRQLSRTKSMLRRVSDVDITNLPRMEDPDILAAMRMLNILFPYVFSCKPEYSPLIIFRMIQLTLTGGMSSMACVGFASYGMLSCLAFGSVDDGYRFGQLGLCLAHKYKAREWYPRVYTAVFGMINTWKEPWIQSLQPLHRAYHLGLASGDMEISMISAALYSSIAFYTGSTHLNRLRGEMEEFLSIMIDCNQEQTLILPTYQLTLNFLGCSNDDPSILSSEVFRRDNVVKEARETNNEAVLTNIYQSEMIARYYMGNYEGCFAACRERRLRAPSVESSFAKSLAAFLGGLTALALASSASRRSKRHQYVRVARKDVKQLEKLAKHCQRNERHRICLLRAEFAALADPDVEKVIEHYIKAAEYAALEKNLAEEALAYERAGIFLQQQRSNNNESTQYLRRACSLFLEWGATARVEKMYTDHASLRVEETPRNTQASNSTTRE